MSEDLKEKLFAKRENGWENLEESKKNESFLKK